MKKEIVIELEIQPCRKLHEVYIIWQIINGYRKCIEIREAKNWHELYTTVTNEFEVKAKKIEASLKISASTRNRTKDPLFLILNPDQKIKLESMMY